jgi:protease-4
MKKAHLFMGVLLVMSFQSAAFLEADSGEAALVDLSGSITPNSASGLVSSGGITPEKVRSLNERAVSQGADAIVYQINSPGGAVVASKEIKREIDRVEVPTVCRLRDTAASGGYLIALGCDRIVADSATLTGSIGVTASYLEFSGLLDRLGVEYVNVSAGEFKEAGSPLRNATPEEKALLRGKIDSVQNEFVSLVREERNMTGSDLSNATTGELIIGERALELGMVDSLGGRREALKQAEQLTDLNLTYSEVETQESLGLFSLLSAKVFGASTPSLQARL